MSGILGLAMAISDGHFPLVSDCIKGKVSGPYGKARRR